MKNFNVKMMYVTSIVNNSEEAFINKNNKILIKAKSINTIIDFMNKR